MSDNVFDDLISEDNKPKSNWFKFEKVGDTAMGILVELKDKPAQDDFKAQRVFVLKQKDGTLLNVGISIDKDYVLGRANTAKLGDAIAFKFEKEIPASKKGFKPAKSIEVYVKHLSQEGDGLESFGN